LKRTRASKTFAPENISRSYANFEFFGKEPGSYSAEDLSKAIIDLLHPKSKYTKQQLRGREKFKHCGSWNLFDTENTKDLKNYYDIFNDVFFNGVLKGLCTLGEPKSTASA